MSELGAAMMLPGLGHFVQRRYGAGCCSLLALVGVAVAGTAVHLGFWGVALAVALAHLAAALDVVVYRVRPHLTSEIDRWTVLVLGAVVIVGSGKLLL